MNSSRGLPSSGRLPSVSSPTNLPLTSANDSSTGTSTGPTADLGRILHPMNRSADVFCRHFDLIAVEMLGKLLQDERTSPTGFGLSVSRREQGKLHLTAAGSGVGDSSPYQISATLRAALLTMGFVGVKRVMDAMWTAAFGTLRCDLEQDLVPAFMLDHPPPHLNPPGPGGSSEEEIQKVLSRGTTTILQSGDDYGTRSPASHFTASNAGLGILPFCNEDCKDHMSPQDINALQKERERNVRSMCACMEMHFNVVLLQYLQCNLFPTTENVAAPLGVSITSTANSGNSGGAAPYHNAPLTLSTAVGGVPTPSPPSVRQTGDSFQRRHLYSSASTTGSAPNGATVPHSGILNTITPSESSTSPAAGSVNQNVLFNTSVETGGIASVASFNLVAIAQVMDQRDDKGSSLRGMQQESVRNALSAVLVHYHLHEIDVVMLYAVFLDTILEIRQRVFNGSNDFNTSSTVALNNGPPSSTTTELKPLLLVPHSGCSSPLVYQWFEKHFRSSFNTASEILYRCRADVTSNAVATFNSSSSMFSTEAVEKLKGSSISAHNGVGDSLFIARAHHFFKEWCPMRYADPRLMHNPQRTPTLFQEGLSKASTYVLHSTDLVFLRPSAAEEYPSEWSGSSKMWSIRTRLITLRGHYLCVYSAIASSAAMTEFSGEVPTSSGRSQAEVLTYDSPISIIDLSRGEGSTVYLVSGRHDIEAVYVRSPGRATGFREQPLWSVASSGSGNLNSTNNNPNSGGGQSPNIPINIVNDETNVLRTCDPREIQLLTLTIPHRAAMSTNIDGNDKTSSSSKRSQSSLNQAQDPAAPPNGTSQMIRWLGKHRYKSIPEGTIRQRMYPIRLLCGNELHHFLFQCPGVRAKWYQFFEELTVMLHNQKQLRHVTQSFCNLAAYLRNRIPYPVGPAAFEAVSMLGAGTYGHVLLVRHKLTRKYFAMKVVRKTNFVSIRSIIEARRECSILQSLDCPYIMKLHDAYQTDTCVYFLLEFLSGGDLLKHIQNAPERHLSEAMSRFILAEVAIALEHLRVRGIVHRDLKGDNLVMDSEGHVILTDFGFAKRITADPSGGSCMDNRSSSTALASTSTIPAHSGCRSQLRYHMAPEEPWVVIPQHNRCGTVAYIAPEVLRSSHQGEGYGLEVDWWSLGVVFFTLLTGLFPFFKDTTKETTNEILHGIVRFPHEMRGGKNLNLSKEVQDLVQRLLEKKPRKRISCLKDLKQHPFFRGFDWEACEARRMIPPQELHVDMYAPYFSAKDSTSRLKHRVEWATQQQMNPPEDPPLRLPVEDASPYKTSEAMLEEFEKHSMEWHNMGERYGMEQPHLTSVQSDIFHPLFARQERCGSDRDIFGLHHDALPIKSADGGADTMEDDLAEDYIPHAVTTASSLGYGFPNMEATSMSGSFSMMGGAYRSVHSPTAMLGFSGTSATHDVPFGFSMEETTDQGDSLVLTVDPILEDFDEAAYQNFGIRETQFAREGNTSIYRPYYS